MKGGTPAAPRFVAKLAKIDVPQDGGQQLICPKQKDFPLRR